MKLYKKIPKGWQPPHCPSPKCLFHNPLIEGFTFKKAGFYDRLLDGKRIQRFTCKLCGRSFSTQTFSTTYWQKRPDLDVQILMKTVGGMANRQIARDLNVAPSTVDRHIERLGRHSLLLHYKFWQYAEPPTEVVVDGFQSFELSQYYPFHHHIAVEKDTDFFIYFTDSELRRSGSMKEEQKKRRAELETLYGVPDPQAVRKDMRQLLEVTLQNQTSATVHSDAHKSYPWAIRKTDCRITHVVTPGKDHRDRHNKLWEVNLTDLLIRHSSANHKRETIAWSKRRASSAYRMAIFMVWRNYGKGRREKDRASPTPAMARGLLDHKMDVQEMLSGRIFRDHIALPERWAEYYDMTVKTRALGKQRGHALTYAR